MSDYLLAKIGEINMEVADDLRDGGMTTEDIKDLCFESLKEIIPAPGCKGAVLRSRVWKVILDFNKNGNTNDNPKVHVPLVQKMKYADTIVIGNDDEDETESKKPLPHDAVSFHTQPLSTSQVRSPQYIIYKDRDVDSSVKAGNIPVELHHRIIRGTIHNMMSTSLNPPWERMPTNNELLEMAKSLIIAYPLLCDPVTKHGVVLTQLKKRMYNMKPVENKRGPKKIKKEVAERDKVEGGKPEENKAEGDKAGEPDNDVPEKQQLEDSSHEMLNNIESKPHVCDSNIMERHYSALAKEMEKSKPCPVTINTYLNKEFESRRVNITKMSAESRHTELLAKYPCFKNHVEIIEEVRRIVHQEELYESPEEFLTECVERLSTEVEYTIYFGVYNKSIGHPCKPTPTAKIIHMLQNLHLIFHRQMGKSSKGGKKIVDLVYVLKDHEDPEVICSRKQHCHGPMLILDTTSAYLICKGSIMCVVQLKKLKEAVLALIGSYYLLDIDYPQSHELGLTMLQHLVFKDKSSPGDLLNAFNATIASYTAFKNSGN